MTKPAIAAMPLLWLSAAFLAGLVASSILPLLLPYWIIAAVISFVLVFFEKYSVKKYSNRARLLRLSPFPVSCLLLVFFGGAAYFKIVQPVWTSTDLAWYNYSGEAVLTGWVAEVPDEREKVVLLKVQIESIQEAGAVQAHPVSGRLLARVAAPADFHYGDRLQLNGKPITPPRFDDFSYQEFLARSGIYTYISYPEIVRLGDLSGSPLLRFIFQLRSQIKENISGILPNPEAALLSGVLLGDDNGFSSDVQQAFRETGTAHILAVSGFNISILAALLSGIFKRVLKGFWPLLFVVLGITLFSLMVGGQASVVRAAIMGVVAQIGLAIGRRQTAWNSLVFTAAAMAAINPFVLWDIGFQLSFSATLGIILFGDSLTDAAQSISQRLFPPSYAARIGEWLAEFVLITLAAQVMTLPISVYHFHTFSWIGLLTNSLVLPAQEFLMILGGMAAIFSLIFYPLGQLFAWLAWPFSAYTLACVRLLASLAQGYWQTDQVSLLFVISYFIILFALFYYRKKVFKFLRKNAFNIALVFTGILMVLVWRSALASPDGKFHLIRFDTSSGTTYFLQTPGGNQILINGVTQPLQTSEEVGHLTPTLDRKLDAIILTEEKAGVEKGLPQLLANVTADQILTVPALEKPVASHLDGDQLDVPVSLLKSGRTYSIGEEASLSILRVEPNCADILVTYQRFRLFIPSCPITDTITQPSDLTGLSLVSLSKAELNKKGSIALAEMRPLTVIAPFPNPGLALIPNWMAAVPGSSVHVISDGLHLGVNSKKEK